MSKARRTTSRATDVAHLFDGSRLTLARQLAGLRKNELAARVDKSPTAVAAFESNAKRPTASTVAQLALGLSVDPAFFAVRPEDVTVLKTTAHFRSLRSTSQLSRDQAIAYGQLAIDIAGTFERYVEFPEPDLPEYPVHVEDADGDGPEQAARLVREVWGLGEEPIAHLVRILENRGVLVVFSPVQTSSVDAYSFVGPLRPVVVLNPLKHDYYRQRFDVAHELGHLVMHSDAEPGSRIVEEQANRFASELLMPAAGIRELLPTTMSGRPWRTLGQLKEQWGVSMQALLYRARRLETLSDISYRNAMATISARGWRRDEPGRMIRIEQPSLLPRTLELLAHEDIDENVLIEQCAVPRDLFHIITARTPDAVIDTAPDLALHQEPSAQVISLLDWHERGSTTSTDDYTEAARPEPSSATR
ncbi:helix-turn-helix domain-containing protein [Actinospica robiniae]|uniref:helix-turn-helix domain-containing protein n=1 Tax=Actinospica robiniae TaxID=304901 RepID=UPI0004129A64|nr:ImmA/IrrE family metallo-endopeptidase [Actinospica robiniae]